MKNIIPELAQNICFSEESAYDHRLHIEIDSVIYAYCPRKQTQLKHYKRDQKTEVVQPISVLEFLCENRLDHRITKAAFAQFYLLAKSIEFAQEGKEEQSDRYAEHHERIASARAAINEIVSRFDIDPLIQNYRRQAEADVPF